MVSACVQPGRMPDQTATFFKVTKGKKTHCACFPNFTCYSNFNTSFTVPRPLGCSGHAMFGLSSQSDIISGLWQRNASAALEKYMNFSYALLWLSVCGCRCQGTSAGASFISQKWFFFYRSSLLTGFHMAWPKLAGGQGGQLSPQSKNHH